MKEDYEKALEHLQNALNEVDEAGLLLGEDYYDIGKQIRAIRTRLRLKVVSCDV